MSGLQLPGALPPVQVQEFSGPNAVPVSGFFAAGGVFVVTMVGGLTKRQELAARFLAATNIVADARRAPSDAEQHRFLTEMTNLSLKTADYLLAATEPQPTDDALPSPPPSTSQGHWPNPNGS